MKEKIKRERLPNWQRKQRDLENTLECGLREREREKRLGSKVYFKKKLK